MINFYKIENYFMFARYTYIQHNTMSGCTYIYATNSTLSDIVLGLKWI